MRTTLNIETALLADGWSDRVSIDIEAGVIADIRVAESNTDSEPIPYQPGCLLPGMSNLHSHAHQRAMAGLAEKSGDSADSFWTWRKQMYRFLDRMQPEHLEKIASQLYLEMLQAGYTRVAEFQYLHHQADGSAYQDRAEMSKRCIEAAHSVGLGMTCLPVHYQFGGFGEQPIAEQQRRFYNEADGLLTIIGKLKADYKDQNTTVIGLAAHSLRASSQPNIAELLSGISQHGAQQPIHIHIAEQKSEVSDCLDWSGARPVEYLFDQFEVDQQWCLIHATHLTQEESDSIARSGAVVGLCPTTEANLGDGLFPAKRFLDAGGCFGIGSDSHISVSVVEELRWLEYGQRLNTGDRNHLSGGSNSSTGRRLFDMAVQSGARACASNAGVIEIGRPADFIVLDTEHPLLACRQGDDLLDSWIFSGNQNLVRDVYVAGEQVICDGRHVKQQQIAEGFIQTLKQLS